MVIFGELVDKGLSGCRTVVGADGRKEPTFGVLGAPAPGIVRW